MFKAIIKWGVFSPEQEPQTYEFKTEAELEAFLYGISEMDGWMGYEIVSSSKETES